LNFINDILQINKIDADKLEPLEMEHAGFVDTGVGGCSPIDHELDAWYRLCCVEAADEQLAIESVDPRVEEPASLAGYMIALEAVALPTSRDQVVRRHRELGVTGLGQVVIEARSSIEAAVGAAMIAVVVAEPLLEAVQVLRPAIPQSKQILAQARGTRFASALVTEIVLLDRQRPLRIETLDSTLDDGGRLLQPLPVLPGSASHDRAVFVYGVDWGGGESSHFNSRLLRNTRAFILSWSSKS
jgi:hypothetical protein